MGAALDTDFSFFYCDRVPHKLLPLFLSPMTESKSPCIYSLKCLLVTLSDTSLIVWLLMSFVPHKTLLVYQFAFKGGAWKTFAMSHQIVTRLVVMLWESSSGSPVHFCREPVKYMTNCGLSWAATNLWKFNWSSPSTMTRSIYLFSSKYSLFISPKETSAHSLSRMYWNLRV